MTKDGLYNQGQIQAQEVQIISLDKMINGTGYDLILSDKGKDLRPKIEGVPQEEVLEYLIDIQEDPFNPHPDY